MSQPPVDGAVYDPEDSTYWEPKALKQEVSRAFEICQGCRKCIDHCEVFPKLFQLIDNGAKSGATVSGRQAHRVMNSCFQCKLCEVQCPYGAKDNHELNMDFPNLIQRYQAQQIGKQDSPTAREKILGDLYSSRKKFLSPWNFWAPLKRTRLFRRLLALFYGIHHKKKWPVFAAKTFEDLADEEGWFKAPSSELEAVFFQSCTVDTLNTDLGRDAVFVLQANGVKSTCVKGLGCCGMPDANDGNLTGFRKKAKHNIELLLPFVENGAKILLANPSCSLMMKREYLRLLEKPWREKAQKIAAATTGVTDFIWKRRTREDFASKKTESPYASMAYHISCHQRAQGPTAKGRDLIRKVGEVKVTPVMTCCGHGGGHAMKSEFYGAAKEMGKKAFEAMENSGEALWITECPMAPLQFEEQGKANCMHPLTFLANSYRDPSS